MDISMLEHFERWLPVVGYEGLYEVSNCGRIRSLGRKIPHKHAGHTSTVPGRILSPFPKKNDYLCVSLLSRDSKREQAHVAHLVAAAFIGPRPGGFFIDHKDGNKRNNGVWNLRYLTPKESSNAGNFDFNTSRGDKRSDTKISDADVIELRRLSAEGMLQKDLAKMFNIGKSQTGRIIRRERRNHES